MTTDKQSRTVLTLAAIGAAVLAVSPAAPSWAAAAPAYRLIDLGTFGGPHADVEGPAHQITGTGAVLGLADTTKRDVDSPNDGMAGDDRYIFHAFAWQNGGLSDLGALPGNNSSAVFEINPAGLGVGVSETGLFDPRAHAPSMHPVLFHDGAVVDLGTLPGGSEGFAVSVNGHGVVGGISNSGRPGPGMPLFFDWGGQIRSFIWQRGVMRDIGTLGGPGAILTNVNEHGQVSGDSYVNSIPDPETGFPVMHPFLWQDGAMHDLGTLGGSQTFTAWMNERGQTVGRGQIAGDQTFHPFLWDGGQLRDLGTLGGDYAEADRINDSGAITGLSQPSTNNTVHAFVWRRGVMTDLSPGDGQCTYPEWINSQGDIVGGTCDGSAVLWHSDQQYDLNTLIGATRVQLTSATYVDARGRIVALGQRPNGNQHVYLLVPTGAELHRSTQPIRESAPGGPLGTQPGQRGGKVADGCAGAESQACGRCGVRTAAAHVAHSLDRADVRAVSVVCHERSRGGRVR